MDKEIKTEAQTLPAVAGQVEFVVRPDVPEVNFGDMPMGAVYTPSLRSVGAAMYTYTAGQMIQYAARKAREARDAERERCAQLCEQEICACCWDDDAQAAAEHLAAEIRKGPNAELTGAARRAGSG